LDQFAKMSGALINTRIAAAPKPSQRPSRRCRGDEDGHGKENAYLGSN
jgi:hypothetical protein